MRCFAVAILGLFLHAAIPSSAIAAPPPIVTRDPGQYAQVFSDSMTLGGVAPIRDAYQVMFTPNGGQLPVDIEAALIVYERAIGSNHAGVARVVDDLVLSDAFRTIFLYHYFGANTWIFTRLDFVRVTGEEWALSAVSFASEWSRVVVTTTPGFHPPLSRRN